MTSIVNLIILALQIPAVIFATTLHEFSRAAVSTILGDKKPKNEGRLTLNPIKHFEPVGFILMWATGFGWCKPVETSPMFYKKRKRDTLITAIAPTVINLIAALVSSVIYSLAPLDEMGIVGILLSYLLVSIKQFNIYIAVYNIVPVSPMDCVKVLSCVLPANSYFKYIQYEKIIQMVFLLLLFMGYTDFIINPIVSIFMAVL